MDGGGIYGLTEALWLKKLCQRCPWFLSGEDVQVFAGCSAGAINALLLARHERPREAVLSGELEAFWTDTGTFTNSDPVNSYLSWFGLAPWFSDQDFLKLLKKYFGDTTLKDVKQRVLITAYSWTGNTRPDFSDPPYSAPWPFSLLGPGAVEQAATGKASWCPLYIHNFPPPGWKSSEDDGLGNAWLGDHFLITDLAYAAATPPGFRKIRGGVGDGASFNANPALAAIVVAHLFHDMLWAKTREAYQEEIKRATPDDPVHSHLRSALLGLYADPTVSPRELDFARLSLLSIGAGQAMPAYWLRNIDLGFSTFQSMPTNPLGGNWFPPTAYGLDPAEKDAANLCAVLLKDRFFRINPPVLWVPTVMAAYLARFPLVLQQLIQQIYAAVETPDSLAEVDGAVEFLQSKWMMPGTAEQFVEWIKPEAEKRATAAADDTEAARKERVDAVRSLLALPDLGKVANTDEFAEVLVELLSGDVDKALGLIGGSAELTKALAEAVLTFPLTRDALTRELGLTPQEMLALKPKLPELLALFSANPGTNTLDRVLNALNHVDPELGARMIQRRAQHISPELKRFADSCGPDVDWSFIVKQPQFKHMIGQLGMSNVEAAQKVAAENETLDRAFSEKLAQVAQKKGAEKPRP
jgi:hypothetical protein